MQTKKRWLFFLVTLGTVSFAQAAEVAGVKLDDVIRITADAPPLVLNGAGVRKKFFFSVNVVGLYLPETRDTSEEILALPGPKRVTLVMLRDVEAQQFIDAFNDGLKANSRAEDIERMRPQIEAFEALMRELGGVKKGDVVNLDYQPNKGTQLNLNGDTKGKIIEGTAFYRALLLNWLGDQPADPNLKRALLGGE